jgi:HSP20 family molecular chaperone IbpA
MHGDFSDIRDEMDALMDRLMARYFTGFGEFLPDIQPVFGRRPNPDSCSCTESDNQKAGVVEPPAEVHRTPGMLSVVTELPGTDERGITLDLQGDTLIIEADAGDLHYRTTADIRGAPVGPVESSFRNGVLEVRFRSRDKEEA